MEKGGSGEGAPRNRQKECCFDLGQSSFLRTVSSSRERNELVQVTSDPSAVCYRCFGEQIVWSEFCRQGRAVSLAPTDPKSPGAELFRGQARALLPGEGFPHGLPPQLDLTPTLEVGGLPSFSWSHSLHSSC